MLKCRIINMLKCRIINMLKLFLSAEYREAETASPWVFMGEAVFYCAAKKRKNMLTNISIYSNKCIQKVVFFQKNYRKRERRLNYVDKQWI